MLSDLDALRRAKVERGFDWYLCSSWCSDTPIFVLILRKPGAKLGQPMVGELEAILSRAAKEVGA